jgi:hypothetical protein
MQDWLNRLGLTLQFLALFFVTPQIVGEKLMLKAGERLHAFAGRWGSNMKVLGSLLAHSWPAATLPLFLPVLLAVILVHVSRTGPVHSAGHWIGMVTFWVYLGLASIGTVLLAAAPVMRGLSGLIKISTRSAHALLITGAILFATGYAVLLTATWTHT